MDAALLAYERFDLLSVCVFCVLFLGGALLITALLKSKEALMVGICILSILCVTFIAYCDIHSHELLEETASYQAGYNAYPNATQIEIIENLMDHRTQIPKELKVYRTGYYQAVEDAAIKICEE
jgi:hypothetical protein